MERTSNPLKNRSELRYIIRYFRKSAKEGRNPALAYFKLFSRNQLTFPRFYVIINHNQANKDNNMSELNLHSLEEKILFVFEFEGQASDGIWENSNPDHHYKFWMLKWNQIGIDSENPGIDFNSMVNYSKYQRARWHKSGGYYQNFTDRRVNAPKKSYSGLVSKENLEYIGERMCNYLSIYMYALENGLTAITQTLEEDHHLMPDSITEYDWIEKNQDNDYWVKKNQKLNEIGLTKAFYQAALDNKPYTFKDLRKIWKSANECFKLVQKGLQKAA